MTGGFGKDTPECAEANTWTRLAYQCVNANTGKATASNVGNDDLHDPAGLILGAQGEFNRGKSVTIIYFINVMKAQI